MCGVGADVASLVIAVDDEVQPHQFVEVLVGESKHLCKVGCHIQMIIGRDDFALMIDVAVYLGGNARQEGDKIQVVLVDVFPVLSLRDAVVIGLGELAFVLQGGNADN